MIDSPTYRLAEDLAKRQAPTWQLANTHTIPFENHAFPRRFNSNQELAQIVDIMQEGRFDAYMTEWGGLSEPEYTQFMQALEDLIELQWFHFPGARPKLPLDTLLSHFSIAKKLASVAPNYRSVLEIGSGCGYVPYFLRHHTPLLEYSQLEACEAFYVLQSLVNSQIFGPQFDERALPQGQAEAGNFFTTERAYNNPIYLEVKPTPRCIHYPWWRLGELAQRKDAFDLVTTNANLCEIHDMAFRDYLALIKQVLKPDGYVIAQCIGGFIYRDWNKLADELHNAGFAPQLFIAMGGAVEANLPNGQRIAKHFTVGQAVVIQHGHPQFERYYHRNAYQATFLAADSAAVSIFENDGEPRRLYSTQEVHADIEARFRTKYLLQRSL